MIITRGFGVGGSPVVAGLGGFLGIVEVFFTTFLEVTINRAEALVSQYLAFGYSPEVAFAANAATASAGWLANTGSAAVLYEGDAAVDFQTRATSLILPENGATLEVN